MMFQMQHLSEGVDFVVSEAPEDARKLGLVAPQFSDDFFVIHGFQFLCPTIIMLHLIL